MNMLRCVNCSAFSALFAFAIITFSLLENCDAQVITADLEGKVVSEADILLPNALVTLRNQETGIRRETFTASTGRYRIAALKPGEYEITVKLSGYIVEIRKNIVLEVGQVYKIDFELIQVPSAGPQFVEVIGKAPLVETTESMISTVINAEQIRNLPLNSRTVAELALLAPGVSAFRSSTPAFSPLNFGATNNRSTRFFVDGIDFSSDALGGILLPVPVYPRIQWSSSKLLPVYSSRNTVLQTAESSIQSQNLAPTNFMEVRSSF